MRDSSFDRRTILKAMGALPMSVALAPAFAGEAVAADIGVSVFPFPLSAVRLSAGPFLDNMNRQLAYFRFVDADRLLHTFRTNVGLSSTAQPCGGWESPTTELRGHSTGHLLSGLAMAYANTGDATYKTKGDYLVSSMAVCQARATQQGYHAGYLSAFPENFFDRLESGQSVWAPYYTLHKILAGLLDQYLLAGNQQALDVLLRKAAWTKARTDPLSYSQMQQVLRTEFGGMPEVLADLYLVTGNADHLTTAQRFDHAQILDPLAANQDRLAGFHANTQIPKSGGQPPQGTTYEAEAGALGGQAAVRSSSGASGGALVGYVGNGTANYLQFNNVNATAGTHTVTIFYASGANRSLTINANGGTATTVTTPSTGGWDTIGSVTTTLTLTAGTNTIRIGNPTGWAPDIDRIVVA